MVQSQQELSFLSILLVPVAPHHGISDQVAKGGFLLEDIGSVKDCLSHLSGGGQDNLTPPNDLQPFFIQLQDSGLELFFN